MESNNRLRKSLDAALAVRPAVLAAGAALALIAQLGSQQVLNSFYARSGYPVPYYEGQLSFSADRLEGWYGAMQNAGTLDIYWQTQFVDFVFIAMTALHFVTLMLLAIRLHAPGSTGRRVLRMLLPVALIGPVFDALENLVSFVMLRNPDDIHQSVAVVYSSMATIKFVGFALLYTIALAGLVTAAVSRARRRRTGENAR